MPITAQYTSHFNALGLSCPSAEAFFSGKTSQYLGYIPIVGTVIGISRIFFAAFQYSQGIADWNKERFVEQIKRGTMETLCLGLIYDIFSGQPVSQPPRFSPLASTHFPDHAAKLASFFASMPPPADLQARYATYRSTGGHAYRGEQIFQGADFYVRHGITHAAFVALFVPIFIALYQNAGHPEASSLTQEEILGLQAVAFFHDYGRLTRGADLCGDYEELERIGQKTACQYLREAMGFSEETAKRLSMYILTKDSPLPGKNLLCQILQNCDCLAVLRADDWEFSPRYLDLIKWIQTSLPDGPAKERATEELHTVIDDAKRFLVSMGDSPWSMRCLSRANAGQTIQGNFSLATKRTHEKDPLVYAHMLQQMQGYPALHTLLRRF